MDRSEPGSIDIILRWLRGPAPKARWRMHIGDSHLGPPDAFVAGLAQAATETSAYRYSAPGGLPSLRAALATSLRARCDSQVRPSSEQVVVTVGGSQASWSIASTLLRAGDSALILSPHWVIFRLQVASVGAEPIEVPFFEAGRTPAVDAIEGLLDRYAQSSTRLLYFANPNNPDGSVISAEVLEELRRVAEARGWALVSDEVYEGVAYTPAPSAAGFAGRVFTVHSFSKLLGLAGARVGFLTAPVGDAGVIEALLHQTTFCVPPLLQHACLAALGDLPFAEHQRATFLEARDRSAAVLGVRPPDGGVYHYLRLADTAGRDGFGVARAMLRDTDVAVCPGVIFGAAYSDYVRFCFASAPPDEVETAARHVRAWFDQNGVRVVDALPAAAP